jgi:serine/threonine-protein kinase
MNLTPEVATTYRQPEPPATVATPSARPRPVAETRPIEPAPTYTPTSTTGVTIDEIDWAAVGLGLIALMTVGGLVPFWIYIYFLYNPR